MPLLISFLGEYLLWLILILCLFFGSRPFVSAGLALTLSWLIKNLYYLPRPFVLSHRPPLLPYLSDGSLPSSHTAIAVALAMSVFFISRRWGLVFLVLAALVAVGRVLGGVHTYLDVLTGTTAGVISSLAVRYFLKPKGQKS